MKGLYLALKCFMLEFWDLNQYQPSWNSTINTYFASLPMDAEAKCIHMQQSTRICQLKVLWANMMVQYPPADDTRWSEPVMKLLQERLAMPHDIFAMNFGLWYNPETSKVGLWRGDDSVIVGCYWLGGQYLNGALLTFTPCTFTSQSGQEWQHVATKLVGPLIEVSS
jgi:hypothetical protein